MTAIENQANPASKARAAKFPVSPVETGNALLGQQPKLSPTGYIAYAVNNPFLLRQATHKP